MNFVDLIHLALLSDGGEKRCEAERELIKIRTDNPTLFFEACMAELSQDTNSISLRQASAILLAYSSSKMVTDGNPLWMMIDEKLRSNIKLALLALLIHPELLIRRAIADSISSIFSIELPLGEWTDLIPVLSHTTNSENLIFRSSGIETLGFVCEKLSQNGKKLTLEKYILARILAGICSGITTEPLANQELAIRSIKALRDSLNFMEPLITETQQVRDSLISLIVSTLLLKDLSLNLHILECLGDFCKIYYDYLSNYINQIWEIVNPYMGIDEYDVAKAGIGVWNSIAHETIERIKFNSQKIANRQVQKAENYVGLVSQQIVQILLQNLLQNDQGGDQTESTIQKSSQGTLINIVELAGNAVFDRYLIFISNKIRSDQWNFRQASIIAFNTLLDSPQKEKVGIMVSYNLGEFFKLLGDKEPKVAESAAELIQKIAEKFQKLIFNSSTGPNDLQILIRSLSLNPKISRHICQGIFNLNQKIDRYPDSLYVQNIHLIAAALFKNAFRTDLTNKDLIVIDYSLNSVMDILFIIQIKDQNLYVEYLKQCETQLMQSFTLVQPEKNHIQEGLLSILHPVILGLSQIEPKQLKLDPSVIKNLYTIVKDYFKEMKMVTKEGLYVIGAMATLLKENYIDFLEDSWGYITHALVSFQDAQIRKIAILCIADIARAVGAKFSSKLSVVTILIQIAKQPTFDRELQLTVFLCLGDVFLAVQQNCFPFIKDIISLFDTGFAAYEISKTEDADSKEYLEELKQTLVDSYTCLIHGVIEVANEREKTYIIQDKNVLSHIPNMIQFLELTCGTKLSPTLDYLKLSLYLIADIRNFCKTTYHNIDSLTKTQFVSDLFDNLRKFIHDPESQKIIYYLGNMLSN